MSTSKGELINFEHWQLWIPKMWLQIGNLALYYAVEIYTKQTMSQTVNLPIELLKLLTYHACLPFTNCSFNHLYNQSNHLSGSQLNSFLTYHSIGQQPFWLTSCPFLPLKMPPWITPFIKCQPHSPDSSVQSVSVLKI